MWDLVDSVGTLSATPVPAILVAGGVVFLALALAGGYRGRLEIPHERQKWTAALGTALLLLGLALYLAPAPEEVQPMTALPAAERGESAPGDCSPDLTLSEPDLVHDTVIANGSVVVRDGCPPIAKIHWAWGDGHEQNSWFPVKHTYRASGEYEVIVTAFDRQGNSAIERFQLAVP